MHANVSNGFKRYSLAGVATTAFTITAGGLYKASSLPNGVAPIGDGLVTILAFSGDRVAGANNRNFTARIWGVHRLYKTENDLGDEYLLFYVGLVAATLGNIAPVTGGLALTGSERMADTLTFTAATDATTPKGPFTIFETGLAEGVNETYSPADDTPAYLLLPSLGRATGIYIDFDNDAGGSAVELSNAFILNKPA